LAALEHVAVSVREITRVLAERTEADGAAVAEVDRAALADLLGGLANVVRAFGRVAVGETGGASGPDADLLVALDRARRTRDRVASVLAVDAGQEPGLWAMNGALLQAAARIIREVDLEAGPDARHVPRSAPHPSPPARSAAAAVRAARNASRSLAANRLPSRTLAMAARARRSLDGLG
jgi:hypothetical protein